MSLFSYLTNRLARLPPLEAQSDHDDDSPLFTPPSLFSPLQSFQPVACGELETASPLDVCVALAPGCSKDPWLQCQPHGLVAGVVVLVVLVLVLLLVVVVVPLAVLFANAHGLPCG